MKYIYLPIEMTGLEMLRFLNLRLGRGLAHHLIRSPEIQKGEDWGPVAGQTASSRVNTDLIHPPLLHL